MNLTVDQALLQAVEAHKAGRLQDAERLYRAILEALPTHSDGNHNLGVLAVGLGKPEEALPYLKAALEGNPAQGQFWISYINALIQANHLPEARATLEQAKTLGLSGEPVADLESKLREAPAATGPSPQEHGELLARYNTGNLASAEQIAEKLSQKFPDHPFAWNILGAILAQTGRLDLALAPMQRSLRLDPANVAAHNNLGNVLKDLGRLPEAEASCREAIRLKPDFAQAHSTLGNTLSDSGRLAEAVESYRQAVHLKPDYVQAYCNLGNALSGLGRLAEAEANYREAIRLKPDFAEAHSNLGNVLRRLGRLNEAEASYREAIRFKASDIQAHGNLGNTLRDLGRLTEAEASYRETVRLDANDAQAHSNLGSALKHLGRPMEAEASYREAIRLKPDLAEAHSNLGNALRELGRLTEAEASYREAIRLRPDHAEAHGNLGNALKDFGRLAEAEASYREAVRLKPDDAEARSNLLLALNYAASLSPEEALVEATGYGRAVSAEAQPKFSSWKVGPHQEKLKIGFVSGDLKNHPVGYFIESLLENINQSRFELYAFPTNAKSDDLTSRIQPHFQTWLPIYGMSDLDAATAIHDKAVNVLIDLSGHTAHNRLPVFSRKPAPVQISWLGYFATTGLPEMDYLLGDPFVTPESEAGHFTETIWRLPETYLCFTPPREDAPPSLPPARGNGFITFGCFNNLTKMGPGVVQLWSQILKSVPEAKLFLKTMQLADRATVDNVLAHFAAHGVSGKQLILEGPSTRAELLASYDRVDIALDPFPYPGGTSSAEALWMGVPVLTLKGDRFLSHVGESIASNVGQAGWIAADYDDYLKRAIKYASDIEGLSNLRQGLRTKALQSPLFDARRFARNFEAAVLDMWNHTSS